jgi:hypothetical protein
MEFSYSVQGDRKVLFSNGVVEFELCGKEMQDLRRLLLNALFDGSVKFKCKIDEPECY